MSSPKKDFFYIPTWALILLCAIAAGSILFEVYIIFNIDTFEAITVNGIKYPKGSEQYSSAVKTMKEILGISAIVSLMFSFVAGWFAYKRIPCVKKC